MPFIRCDVTECAYNDDNGECVADLIQVDYDGCLTFEEKEEEEEKYNKTLILKGEKIWQWLV